MVLSCKSQKESSSDKSNHSHNLDSILSSRLNKITSTNGVVYGNLNKKAMSGSYIVGAPRGPYSRTSNIKQLLGQNQLPPNKSGEINTITGVMEEWATSWNQRKTHLRSVMTINIPVKWQDTTKIGKSTFLHTKKTSYEITVTTPSSFSCYW